MISQKIQTGDKLRVMVQDMGSSGPDGLEVARQIRTLFKKQSPEGIVKDAWHNHGARARLEREVLKSESGLMGILMAEAQKPCCNGGVACEGGCGWIANAKYICSLKNPDDEDKPGNPSEDEVREAILKAIQLGAGKQSTLCGCLRFASLQVRVQNCAVLFGPFSAVLTKTCMKSHKCLPRNEYLV